MKIEINVKVVVDVDNNYNSYKVKHDLMNALWASNYEGTIVNIRKISNKEAIYEIINDIHKYRNIKLDKKQLEKVLGNVKDSNNINRFESALDMNLEDFGYKYNMSGQLWIAENA